MIGRFVRRPVRAAATALLLLVGVVCIALPVALLLKDDAGLIDDTRAWLGAGTAQGVPVVSAVSCTRPQRSFASTDRAIRISRWSCALYLAPASTQSAAQGDPFAGRSWEDGMAEWNRRTIAELDAIKARSRLGGIERTLPTNRSDDLPMLRRLSADGEPLRFGVIWGGGELVWRWLAWLLESALFFGIGAALLFGAWHSARASRHGA